MADVTDIDPVDVPVDAPETDAPEFVCDICGKESKSSRGMKRHQTMAHGAGDSAPKYPRKASRDLATELEGTLAAVAMAVTIIDPFDGMCIAQAAPTVAQAWANLAKKNAHVAKFLSQMSGGFAYGEVITATAMMVLPILAHHKMLPASLEKMFTGGVEGIVGTMNGNGQTAE